MPSFRNRSLFRLPSVRVGPVVVAVVAFVLVMAVVALSVINPKPPTRVFEVPIPSERFAR